PADGKQYLSGPDVLDVRDQVKAFQSVAIFANYSLIGGDIRTPDGSSQRIRILPISADYFNTLGATPLIGRAFTRAEERRDARRIVLSHQLWTSYAQRDGNIIGRTIPLNGESYEVVGVMRSTFMDVAGGDVGAWIPAGLTDGERSSPNARSNQYLSAIARLAPGISLAQAQRELDGIVGR